MFTNIFEGRNKRISSLIKLGDHLGRSLRENVEYFSSKEDYVIYLTESGNIIKAKVDLSPNKSTLFDIEVESSEVFSDPDKHDNFVSGKVNTFIHKIFENDFSSAKSEFDNVIDIWENRVKFNKVSSKLEEKAASFGDSQKIIDDGAFSRLQEITPDIITFLKENKEKIFEVDEIKNGIRLSKTLSEAFDTPFMSLEDLSKEGKYECKSAVTDTVYEMVCRQELIKKELLESKSDFQNIWATEDSFNVLASNVYKDEDTILESLAKTITEIPFLALTSKKQLSESITNSLKFSGGSISDKDIKKFASKIFELKKPVRTVLVKTLSEKYGINLQNLKEVPSFKNLLKTQVTVFESLAKLSPKNSVQRKTLSEVATMLKTKNGVESIDVNDYLYDLFSKSNYDGLLTENLMNYMDFHKVADDLGKIGDVLRMLKKAADGPAPMAPQGQEGEMMGASEEPGMGEQPPMDVPGQKGEVPPEAEAPEAMGAPEGEEAQMAADEAEEEFDAEAAAVNGEVPEEEEEDATGEESMELDTSEDGEEEEESPEMDQDEIHRNIAELEDLLADLTSELGGAQEDFEEDMGEETVDEYEDEAEDAVEDEGEESTEEEAEEAGDVDLDGKPDIKTKKKKKPFPKEV